MNVRQAALALLLPGLALAAAPREAAVLSQIDALYPDLDALYQDLHRTPALSLHEEKLTRFPRPDFAVAIHDTSSNPAGQVAHVPGFTLASVETVEIAFHGKGGHGAAPHRAVDPAVIAARIVVSLQTIVER